MTLTSTGANYINTELKCKQCHKESLLRIKRGVFVKTFLFWRPLKRYRCLSCQAKFYVRDN